MWSQLRGWLFNRGVVSGAILGTLFGLPFGLLIGAVIGLFCGVLIGAGLGLLNGYVLTSIIKRMYATRAMLRPRDRLVISLVGVFTNVVPFYVLLTFVGLNGMSDTHTFTEAVNGILGFIVYPSIIAGLAASYFVFGFLGFADEQWKGLSAGEKQFLFAQFKSEHVHQRNVGE